MLERKAVSDRRAAKVARLAYSQEKKISFPQSL